jgi:hypothetical protein
VLPRMTPAAPVPVHTQRVMYAAIPPGPSGLCQRRRRIIPTVKILWTSISAAHLLQILGSMRNNPEVGITWKTRLFYRRLWNRADDEGCCG